MSSLLLCVSFRNQGVYLAFAFLVVVVVLTLTHIIESVVTGQALVTSERKNTQRKK